MIERIALVAGSLILALLLLSACGSKTPAAPEADASPTVTEARTVAADTAPAETVALQLGESFRTLGPPETAFSVLKTQEIDSYQYKDRASGNMTTKQADEGKSFFIVTVQLEAIGNWTAGWQGNRAPPQGQFTVSDSTGKVYNYGPYLGEKAFIISPDLQKGDKYVGEILYNIPKGSTGLKVEFRGRKAPRPVMAEWAVE